MRRQSCSRSCSGWRRPSQQTQKCTSLIEEVFLSAPASMAVIPHDSMELHLKVLSRTYATDLMTDGVRYLRPWQLPFDSNCGMKGILEPDRVQGHCHLHRKSHDNATSDHMVIMQWQVLARRMSLRPCVNSWCSTGPLT